MTYESAHKIGRICEGYIKCTYAKIYSPTNGKVWSLQQSHMVANAAVDNFNAAVSAVDPATDGTDGSIYVKKEIPVVISTEYNPDDRMANVLLTDEAIELIARKSTPIRYKVPTKWDVYIEIDDEKYGAVGSRKLYKSGLNSIPDVSKYPNLGATGHYVIEVAEYGIESNAEYQKRLADAIEKYGDVVQVKKVAIDWIPTDTDNMRVTIETDGQFIELDRQLAAAEKKYNQAKAIAAAVGVIAII